MIVVPKFNYTATGPSGRGFVQLTSRGLIGVRCDKFPHTSIMSDSMELTIEFDESLTLVCVQVLRALGDMTGAEVKPVSSKNSLQGYAKLFGTGYDMKFKGEFVFDQIRKIVEVRFCNLDVNQTIQWFDSSFIELAVGGLLVRMVFDLTGAKDAIF